MTVGVTGASGLLGRAIVSLLRKTGREVVAFSRQPGSSNERRFAAPLDTSDLDAVIHLAGEPILGVWTAGKRRRILASRESGTRMVAQAIRSAEHPPSVLVSASGVNYYGDRGDEELSEDASGGEGFLAHVVCRWEDAAMAAAGEATRVVCLRLGMVLAAEGGAGKLLYRMFRAGLGGRVGSGRQWMPWIHIDDAAALFVHALDCEGLQGPVNAVAPGVVTNAEFTRAMARVARRPAILPAPAFALRAALGGLSD
ncbi:MAG: TIGR01777 family protein, partial [Akkermansiaceae bacterium]|nr:TIGR01777 family protein [Akkermansiaceae bacterium]